MNTRLDGAGFEDKSIGIIGVGVVGDAVRQYFTAQGTEVALYDLYKQLGSPSEINRADLVFVCVPTPYTPGIGFDASAVEASLRLLRPGKTVVIKSTVLPGTTARLQEEYPDQTVLFNPEFLREKSAVRDFAEPDLQVVGCNPGDIGAARALLRLLPAASFEAVVGASTAELLKYASNSFLAMKVTFANELYDLAEAVNADYDAIKAGLSAEPRIGGSHLDVLAGGYRGYGGACFPKDTMAIMDFAESIGLELNLVRTAHRVNQRLRGESIVSEKPNLRLAS